MRPVVISTSPLPGPALASLEEEFEVRVIEGPTTPDQMREEIRDADAVICLLTDRIDDRMIAAAPKLKIIANCAVGVDNVDRAAAAARGIVVTNTPGVLTEATADLTMALLLAIFRRVLEGDRLVRAGGFSGWKPDLLVGHDLKGKILGIVGPGRIGRATARRAKAFGMVPIAFGRSPRDESDADDPARVSFEDLLRRSDAISLHVPLTPETRHLIDGGAFRRMKPGVVLINTARGAVVDELALCVALEEGTVAGAGLDVYENEPIIAPALLDDDRVVLMPHAGSATMETRQEMARLVCEDVRRVLSGERPLRAIPPERNSA